MLSSRLTLTGLPISLYLGVGEEERAQLQKILLHFELHFPTPPMGCDSDDYAQVICYQTLSNRLLEAIQQKTFKLIEYVAKQALILLREHIPQPIGISVTVEKITIPYIEGTVRFTIAD